MEELRIPRGPALAPALFAELRRQGYGSEAADTVLQRIVHGVSSSASAGGGGSSTTRVGGVRITSDEEARRGVAALSLSHASPLMTIDCRGLRMGDRAAMGLVEALLRVLSSSRESIAAAEGGGADGEGGVPLSGWRVLLDDNALTDRCSAHLQTLLKRCAVFGAPPRMSATASSTAAGDGEEEERNGGGGADDEGVLSKLFPPHSVVLLQHVSLLANPLLSDKTRDKLRSTARKMAAALAEARGLSSADDRSFLYPSLLMEGRAEEATRQILVGRREGAVIPSGGGAAATPLRLTANALEEQSSSAGAASAHPHHQRLRRSFPSPRSRSHLMTSSPLLLLLPVQVAVANPVRRAMGRQMRHPPKRIKRLGQRSGLALLRLQRSKLTNSL